jgi:putative FmdB family regulatory protein
MPTYHYVCSKCGHEFEYIQSMKDDALERCPKDRCARKPWGRGKVQRQMSGGAGLIFKGSGFYITDYRSEGYKEAAKKDVAPAAPKTDTPKPDTKPAAAPAATPAPAAKPAKSS